MREKPIVGRLQHQARGRKHRFMARAADLEEQSVLPLELNLAIVQTPREKHRAINADQRFALEAVVLRRVELRYFYLGLGRHRLSFA